MTKRLFFGGAAIITFVSVASLPISNKPQKVAETTGQISSAVTSEGSTLPGVLGAASSDQNTDAGTASSDQTRPSHARRTNRVTPAPATTPPVQQPAIGDQAVLPSEPVEVCDPNYVPCVPLSTVDLSCEQLGFMVTIKIVDVHGLNTDTDDTACEEYAQRPYEEEIPPKPGPVIIPCTLPPAETENPPDASDASQGVRISAGCPTNP
jgi:hypothetical protein